MLTPARDVRGERGERGERRGAQGALTCSRQRRALFRQPFRGSIDQAAAFVTIIAHLCNARTRLAGGLYEGFGNWSHFPQQPQ